MHFICAEESEKREIKGCNIVGYVPDIQGVVPCGSKIQIRNFRLIFAKQASNMSAGV